MPPMVLALCLGADLRAAGIALLVGRLAADPPLEVRLPAVLPPTGRLLDGRAEGAFRPRGVPVRLPAADDVRVVGLLRRVVWSVRLVGTAGPFDLNLCILYGKYEKTLWHQ